MRFTIEGFSQKRAVELGLSAEDLVILRWFVDYWPSPRMVKMVHDGKEYALVSYGGFIDQMPIIGCNKRTIARKFQRLVDSSVLENTTIRQGGSYSVYRFGKNYLSLVEKCAESDTKENTVVEKCVEGLNKNVQPGMHKNEQTNNSSFKTTNQLSNSSFNTSKADAPLWMDDPDLSQKMASAISDWLEYKKERKEEYKPTGLKALISQIKNNIKTYGDDAVIDVMVSSMGNGYKGICFDKLKSGYKGGNNGRNNGGASKTESEGESRFAGIGIDLY